MTRFRVETGEDARKAAAVRQAASLLVCLAFLLGLVALSAGLFGGRRDNARAATEPGSTPAAVPSQKVISQGGDKTPTSGTGMPQSTVTAISEGQFTGWERLALQDLAGVAGWPTTVAYDSIGRLKVESKSSSTEWSRAHIRVFDYTAGAQAGFSAEQEDSRLEGFTVDTQTFFSYPAYSAVLRDGSGTIVERRFRWLATTWILGVDIRGVGAEPDGATRLLAEQFLSIAVWRGLPPPTNGNAPTPNPTWALPPQSTPSTEPCSAAFSDVGTDYWAYQYIRSLACKGVISGYSDGTFRPENSTTRGQLAKILILATGWQLSDPVTPSFHDVPASHPFYRYIETAAAHHLVTGYSDGNFQPDAFVTRAQVAKMLTLANGWAAQQDNAVQLRDVPPDHWAWPYVQAVIQHGVFTGYGDSYFRPSMLATRAQLAKVLTVSLH